MKARIAAAALVFLTSGCAAQSGSVGTSTVNSASPISIDQNEVRRILSSLAHDSMEGRRTGTAGGRRAASFVAAEMKAIGLAPAGDTGYLQTVPFARGGRRGIQLLDSIGALAAVADSNRIISFNVLGMIRGSDPVLRHEIVAIGAHYDGLGIGNPVGGDSINNGADDDASGVTAVLLIARAIASGPPPKRTILFMSTTGEEQGILGTQYYVKHPRFPISKMVADMEIEMIGRPDSMAGGAGKAWLTGYERSTMGEILKSANVAIVPDPYPQMRFFERSDNIVFARLGIPAHTLSSYNMHTDYHTPADETGRIDFAHMTQVIGAAAKAARLLADGIAPVWKEGGRPVAR